MIVYRRDGETVFLNVDVDVRSASSLEPLARELAQRASIHDSPDPENKRWLHFAPYSPKTAEAAVREIVALIDALSPTARRLWNRAKRRTFDIGIQGGVTPHSSGFALSAKAVAAITRLGGDVIITVYAADTSSTATTPPRKRGRGRPTIG